MIDSNSPAWESEVAAADSGSSDSELELQLQRELEGIVADPPPVASPTEAAKSRTAAAARARHRSLRNASVTAPTSPLDLDATGLSLMYISELVLKHLYLQGNLLGVEIARNVRLPFQIVQEALRWLKDEKCVEVSSGDVIGPASYHFHLSELGRRRAREAFEQCRYVGPAPVPLEDYVTQCGRQAVAGITCSAEALQEAFGELIIRDGLLDELGPAVCSGKSIFIYGPPGNGKTMIAKGLGNFLNSYGGDVFVPYAIAAEGAVITVFDPTIHQPTDTDDLIVDSEGFLIPGLNRRAEDNPLPDARWRRIRRPVVITGGELTLDMLDLRYNRTSNFYTAPLHIKANGGVFLIDDFGRQIVSPRDLLNRWILPLEEHVDYLSLSTGKKFSVPFEQLIIFSTNLDPRELVDEAFLRRIRHKILVGSPSRDLYEEIFQLCCRQRQVPFSPEVVEYLYKTFYNQGKLPRSSDPRDLLEIVKSICRFKKQRVVLTPDLIAESAERFFCQM